MASHGIPINVPAVAEGRGSPQPARARTAGGSPVERLLYLQRTAGNAAVANALAGMRRPDRARPPVIQRLISDGAYELFVPPVWLNTVLDDRAGQTLRQVVALDDRDPLKLELLQNLKETGGVDVGNVVEVDPPGTVGQSMLEHNFQLDGQGKVAKKATAAAIRASLTARVSDTSHLSVIDNLMTTAGVTGAVARPIIHPNELVRSASDLADGFNMEYACPIIAIYKSQSANLNKLITTVGKPVGEGDEGYYRALHRYYYDQQHIEYTEASAHPKMYADWGFNMIFSGPASFAELPQKLGALVLQQGSSYILGIQGHSVYTTMKRTVNAATPLPSQEAVRAAFNFQSDQRNFNGLEETRQVLYIYGR